MLYRIIIGELTWDESNGNTDNQVDGQEDQLTYHQLNHRVKTQEETHPSDRPVDVSPMSKQIDPFHL